MEDTPLKPGLYESLINLALATELDGVPAALAVSRSSPDAAELPDRLALYLGQVVERVLLSVPAKVREPERTAFARNLANKVIDLIREEAQEFSKVDVEGDRFPERMEVLRGIFELGQDGRAAALGQPTTPILDTTLVTNDRQEPSVAAQLKGEIPSADRIDLVMAFIRYTGIRKFINEFQAFLEKSGTPRLRVLTTTYTNSTELRALERLHDLGAEIKVSYDISVNRLHAKAWYFHRYSGAHTAYIGSSNLTHSAQESGMEWNVRASGIRNPDVIRKVASVFEAYWESGDFEPFSAAEFHERIRKQSGFKNQDVLSRLEVVLKPFQERLLEQIQVSRSLGRSWNLLVSATGTGKTVMAAVDFKRLRTDPALKRARLLFIAHRKEILDQSRDTFRQALQDWQFGELWVGGERPSRFEHVFASVQSLANVDLNQIPNEHYDVVVIDEFHHAAASTYQRLLNHLKPKQLLALTATPERADGQDLLHLFDGVITAELRLWDAIAQHSLVPFEYYGISDGTRLTDVPWKRGRGYAIDALEKLYTSDDVWAKRVISQVIDHLGDIDEVVGMGFCVSVGHAAFMAEHFNRAGIAAEAVTGTTPDAVRDSALARLKDKALNFIFSVDVFNEGVDIPQLNTLLFLRPTESPTLFIQQLGRGLRPCAEKSVCTVLDFVGQHRKEFRFDRRYAALLGGTRRQVREAVEAGFPYLPAGCYMELDPVARESVLTSLRNAIPSGPKAMVEELKGLCAQGGDVTLAHFLEASGLNLEDVAGEPSWCGLREAAGLQVPQSGPEETILRKALGRLLHIDDRERLLTYLRWVKDVHAPVIAELTERERRHMRMLLGSLPNSLKERKLSLQRAADLVWSHPAVLSELREVLALLVSRVSHDQAPYDGHGAVALQIHARYSRAEILAAFGEGDVDSCVTPEWREGVRFSKGDNTDIMAFTLSKTPGRFSPTTMYRDYAISQDLIHWESQSGTRADSPTGRRYRNHDSVGSKIVLFARETADERYWCLGAAHYVSHEGERPMAIKWRLEHRLPGDLYAAFVAAVA